MTTPSGNSYKERTKTVLILGGGELGMGLVGAFRRQGCRVVVADRYDGAPAMAVADHAHVLDMTDEHALRALIAEVTPDYIVPEIEAVSVTALADAAGRGIAVVPSAAAVAVAMNRERLRMLADSLGLPVAPWCVARDERQLADAVRRLGTPCFVKPLVSSSGHGMTVVSDAEQCDAAWRRAMTGGRAEAGGVMVEKSVAVAAELTMLTVAHRGGVDVCQPIGQRQQDGNFVESWQPAGGLSDETLKQADAIARSIVGVLGGYGVFGVELFVDVEGRLWFNEVSPRPHDTAMVTLASLPGGVSEFDLHALAALGHDLSDRDLTCRHTAAAVTIDAHGHGRIAGIERHDGAHCHDGVAELLFIKPTVDGHRRVGIVTAVAGSAAEALQAARTHVAGLSVKVVP